MDKEINFIKSKKYSAKQICNLNNCGKGFNSMKSSCNRVCGSCIGSQGPQGPRGPQGPKGPLLSSVIGRLANLVTQSPSSGSLLNLGTLLVQIGGITLTNSNTVNILEKGQYFVSYSVQYNFSAAQANSNQVIPVIFTFTAGTETTTLTDYAIVPLISAQTTIGGIINFSSVATVSTMPSTINVTFNSATASPAVILNVASVEISIVKISY